MKVDVVCVELECVRRDGEKEEENDIDGGEEGEMINECGDEKQADRKRSGE